MNVVSIADIKCINTIETRMNNVLVMTCPIVYQHMQYTFKTTTAEKDVMSPKLVSQSDLNFSFALFSYGLRHAMSTIRQNLSQINVTHQ